MPVTVGDQVGRIIGAPPGSTVMHQNVAIAEAVVLSCFRPLDPRVTASSTSRATSRRSGTSTRRSTTSTSSSARTTAAIVDAIDERTLLVPISHVLFRTGEIQDVAPIIRARARRRRARDPRLLPVRRDRPARRHRARRRLRGRRLGEVALRRPGQRLALRPARSRRPARADAAPAGRRTRSRSRSRRRWTYAAGAARFLTGTPNVPAHYAATAGYDLIEEIGVARIRENSLRQTDLLIDLADAAGFEVRSPRDHGAARRHRHAVRPGLPRRPCRADRAADPLRLPARRRHPPRAALLHDRRRAPARGRPDRGHPRDGRVHPASRAVAPLTGRAFSPGARGRWHEAAHASLTDNVSDTGSTLRGLTGSVSTPNFRRA